MRQTSDRRFRPPARRGPGGAGPGAGLGAALLAAAVLVAQQRHLRLQRQQLAATLDQHRRSGQLALRQLHTDLIRLGLQDPELGEVWPELAPGVPETRKDHYCNLILNLQRVAYDTGLIQEAELRGVLAYLMRSPDVRAFWTKAKAARVQIVQGDEREDRFTSLVARAYEAAPRSTAAGQEVDGSSGT